MTGRLPLPDRITARRATAARRSAGTARVSRRVGVVVAVCALLVTGLGPPTAGAAPASDEPARLLVGRPAGAGPGMAAAAAGTPAVRIVRDLAPIGVTVLELPAGELPAAQRRLQADARVRFVEPDATVTASRVPNDPLWSYQWGPALVDAPSAWTRTTGSADVTVAVLDTGIADHADLAGAVAERVGFVAGTDAADRHGHGSMTAGVLAARTDNARGLAGMCWTCTLLSAKVLGDDGSGRASDVAAGILWAVDRGADVLNLSLGAPQDVRTLRDAVAYAAQRDVLMVAAAGNDGRTDRHYPAGYPAVIAVAATDEADARYTWSTHGAWVDVAAPGCNPATTLGGRYGWYCGTSAATPLAAGILALARAHTDQTATIRAALQDSAVDVGGFVAHGRVDAHATLAALDVDPQPAPDPDPAPAPDTGSEPELAPAPEPEPDPEPTAGATLERLAGVDRYATAAHTSAATFTPGIARAYVATGTAFPDALAAGAAAGQAGGPVLLTHPEALPAATAEELRRLQPHEVIAVGGAAALADSVLAAIRDAVPAATVHRIAGEDRYATAADVATDTFTQPVPTAYVATGTTFADALAGVPAAVRDDGPMLLVSSDRVPAATAAALTALRPRRIVVLGGTAAIDEQVAADLAAYTTTPDAVARIGGQDRYDTAARLAQAAFPDGATRAYLATGTTFPDALAGGAAAAADPAPLLLATPTTLPPATATELGRLQPDVIRLLGGRTALSDDVALAAGHAAARTQPE